MVSTSVIIVTFRRPKEVRRCVQSVLSQTSPPDEIIVVDDSDDQRTKAVVSKFEDGRVRYVRNTRENALTIGRNIGIEATRGELVAFLDDDVILEPDYLEEVAQFFGSHPRAIGVQGYWKEADSRPSNRYLGHLYTCLQLAHHSDSTCRVLKSWKNTYPSTADRGPLLCQWLSGSNMVYRREVFENHRFDEKLLRGSLGEDVDFSYRVWLDSPDSLYLLPSARLQHAQSEINRAPSRSFYQIASANNRYLREKNLGSSRSIFLATCVNLLGELLFYSVRTIIGPPDGIKERITTLKNWASGRWFAFRNRHAIRKGDLSFLDQLMEY